MELTITLALSNAFLYFLLWNKWFFTFGKNLCSFCILWWTCFIEASIMDILHLSLLTLIKAMAMTCISITAYFYLKNNQ